MGKALSFPAQLEGCEPVGTSGHLVTSWGESAREKSQHRGSRAEEWEERDGITSFEPPDLAMPKANNPCNFGYVS